MRKILILMGRYLPGYKDGGPVRTVINLVDLLGDEYDFHIVCLDRDHGDNVRYDNIKINEWNIVGKAKVWYLEKFSFKIVKKLSEDADLIYCCGFYDDYGYKTLILNGFNKLGKKPVVVASMGTFSQGALSHKSLKKKLFIFLLRFLGLFRKITWSVTSELEASDLQQNIGKKSKYIVAEDLPRAEVPGYANRNFEENSIVFLSRICPQKNLLGAIKAVSKVNANILFDIYGPKEDLQYWEKCESELSNLPSNIKWKYCGEVQSEKVQETLQKYNIFLFPTLGENYGHVIFEALSVGCVPIISDQTPWSFIREKQAGFVIDDVSDYTVAINRFFNLSVEKRIIMSQNAIDVAKGKVAQSKKMTGYRVIFGKD